MSLCVAGSLHTGEEGHTHPPGALSGCIQVEQRTVNPLDLFCFAPVLGRFRA